MLTHKKRTIYIFAIASAMNLIFFLIAYYLRLPLWLDTTGTVYITLLLGFPAGFLVGLINNTILSLVFYGFNSLSYYLVSVAVALTSHVWMKKIKKVNIKLCFMLVIFIFFFSAFFVIPLTFIVDKGVPADYWGHRLFDFLCTRNYISEIATILSVSCVKLFDVIITLVIVMCAYKLTPVKLKDSSHIIK